ncbi:hypothetical protein CLIB1444_18S01398 [[Candida] jaroonii]|uniref:Uncharacterized protein n=1 Tax=[Candida] jaroonii TaxID=467808 RepID=A0ACA9YG02_9ASCO|nr:hypothetical protein CLIB1444_18S01398 [[Candida] jaroonii]
MFQIVQLLVLSIYAVSIVGHAIPGRNSIEKQLINKRDTQELIDMVFDGLPYSDIDYINNHVKNLTNFNGSKCDTCKNKIKYAKTMIEQEPENQHLISLTLFKYCVDKHSTNVDKCTASDFFLTTNTESKENAIDSFDSGFEDSTVVNFFDNDFIQMIKNFNMSSELDIEYYCYYKESSACKLPETPDIDALYDYDSKWPAKQPQHYSEPTYQNENRSTFHVLHLTDFHTELRYTVGAEANCSQGICCLPESFNKDLPKLESYNFTEQYYKANPDISSINYSFYQGAQYLEDGTYVKGKNYDLVGGRGYDSVFLPGSTFGGYTCDSPKVLVNNTLIEAAKLHKELNFEFSLFTGDLVDHDAIHCTPEVTKEAEVLTFQLMDYWLKDLQIFPSLGNHDTFPYGQIAPRKYDRNNSYQYNVELMSELWTKDGWIPEGERAQITQHYSGFSVTTRKGLKVIALNSNCYYQKNLWNFINLEADSDPFGQWEFLINELVESEKNQQRVWIMSHIPSGDADALPIQSKIFAKIVERFSPYTIANIFFGHTHKDQFKILYSSNGTDASVVEQDVINMAWIVQSVTPAWEFNPSFKYYEVEEESFNIMNAFNYYAQLNETYITGGDEPVWQLGYSSRDFYDPEGKWPKSSPLNATFWNEFVAKNIANNSNIEFNQKYINKQYRDTIYAPDCANGSEITNDCYVANFCDISGFRSDDYLKCSS